MKGPTHLAAGLAAGIAAAAVLHQSPSLATVGAAGLGAMLPDLDQRAPLRWFTQHRTFTHSLLFLALVLKLYPWVALGMATHILLDMLTPMRVPIFWPWEKPIGLGLVQTGSLAEFGIAAVLSGLLLFAFWTPLSTAASDVKRLPSTLFRTVISMRRSPANPAPGVTTPGPSGSKAAAHP